MENSCIKLDNNALNWSNTSVSKNLSGEKDFREYKIIKLELIKKSKKHLKQNLLPKVILN